MRRKPSCRGCYWFALVLKAISKSSRDSFLFHLKKNPFTCFFLGGGVNGPFLPLHRRLTPTTTTKTASECTRATRNENLQKEEKKEKTHDIEVGKVITYDVTAQQGRPLRDRSRQRGRLIDQRRTAHGHRIDWDVFHSPTESKSSSVRSIKQQQQPRKNGRPNHQNTSQTRDKPVKPSKIQ